MEGDVLEKHSSLIVFLPIECRFITQVAVMCHKTGNWRILQMPWQKVCEMKFAAEDYVITKSEEEKFRRRMAILKAETNTKYSMIPTFVTPYGILRNSHSAFVMNDLKLDDLFVKL